MTFIHNERLTQKRVAIHFLAYWKQFYSCGFQLFIIFSLSSGQDYENFWIATRISRMHREFILKNKENFRNAVKTFKMFQKCLQYAKICKKQNFWNVKKSNSRKQHFEVDLMFGAPILEIMVHNFILRICFQSFWKRNNFAFLRPKFIILWQYGNNIKV